jgi:Secretion system C-terminal sorting domain
LNGFEKPIIAPNPAKNWVSVTFNDALPFDFQITSVDGKVMKTGVSSKDINVSDLPNGLFLLKIQKQGAVFTEKIVVEK